MITAEILPSTSSKKFEIEESFFVTNLTNAVKIVFSDENDSWLGIFESGDSSETVKNIVIEDKIASFVYGNLYLIDFASRDILFKDFNSKILDIEYLESTKTFICVQESSIFAISLQGELLWQARVPPLAINGSSLELVNGIKFLEVNETSLKGKAYCCERLIWQTFILEYPEEGEVFKEDTTEEDNLIHKMLDSFKNIFK